MFDAMHRLNAECIIFSFFSPHPVKHLALFVPEL